MTCCIHTSPDLFYTLSSEDHDRSLEFYGDIGMLEENTFMGRHSFLLEAISTSNRTVSA